MEATLRINEIFVSIQGESSLAGYPTTFIRLTGCNLRCTYCDTTHSYYEGQRKMLREIREQVHINQTKYVCITGGEPLLQRPCLTLMTDLCNDGYIVSLETSGSISCQEVDHRVKIILDVKTPNSGAANSFLFENLNFVPKSTEFKFVITSEEDFEWAEDFSLKHNLFDSFQVLYSPSHGLVGPQWLAEKILFAKSCARLQLQLHKYIWSPGTRGV